MEMAFKEKFARLWKKFFNGALLPITFYYAEESGTADAVKPGAVPHCIMGRW